MSEDKKIKVYFALLNDGWIRREHMTRVIPQMRRTKGVELVVENLAETWDQPIFSNRNSIVRRTLATDCEFMIQMDNDVVPYRNPCELVFANKDIIGLPAKVRQAGRSLNWVAYLKYGGKQDVVGWSPIDFATVDSDVDLLKCDVVGTGCIIVARRVLEKLQSPFTVSIDDYGICRVGTDFSFCDKAGKAGFEIYTAPRYLCEHYKEVGLLDISGYDDSDNRDMAPAKYEMPWGEWAIMQMDWEFITGIMEKIGASRILEFGSGLSTLLFAEKRAIVSFETDPKQKEFVERKRLEAEKVHTFAGAIEDLFLWDGVTLDTATVKGHFDMAFVDGPMGECNGGVGRKNSIRLASELVDHIILHDAGRDEETLWQDVYLRPKFKMVAKNGNHHNRSQYWVRRRLEDVVES